MKQRLIATALMSFGLSFFMSCWVTFINLGFSDTFLRQWMTAFQLAWPVAAVIAFLIGPWVQRTSSAIAERLSGTPPNT